MIKEIYEQLVSNKAEIEKQLQFLDDIRNLEIEKKVKEKWVKYSPKEATGKFIAIDGGEWVKDLRSGTLYVVDAEVIKAEGYKITKLDARGFIGVLKLKSGDAAKELVSLIMQLLELKLAYKYGNEADYILLDGSLSKKIGDREFKEKDSTLDDIDINNDKIYALEESNEALMHKYLIAENHVVISHLIEKYKDKLLWIAKNSRSTELFDENISDIALLDTLTSETGYTKPLEKSINGKNLLSLMATKKLDNMKYYSSYVRLSKGGRVLKIDMFTNDIEKIVDLLSTISIRGYPYPLLKVHTDVKITRQDRERIQQILNIKKITSEWWPNQLS